MGLSEKNEIEREVGDASERKDHECISAEIPDWSREKPERFWDPGKKLLLAIRRYQYWRKKKGLVARFVSKWLVLRYRFWSLVTGSDIALQCKLEGGLLIPHPNGILIHPAR